MGAGGALRSPMLPTLEEVGVFSWCALASEANGIKEQLGGSGLVNPRPLPPPPPPATYLGPGREACSPTFRLP